MKIKHLWYHVGSSVHNTPYLISIYIMNLSLLYCVGLCDFSPATGVHDKHAYTVLVFLISVLLLAYMNGNGNLCRSLVRAGARLGTMNKQGLSIFNAPVATKQLLFKLLGNGMVCFKLLGNGIVCFKLLSNGMVWFLYLRSRSSIGKQKWIFISTEFSISLDMLSSEPPWSEGEICLECGVKFGIKTRKHHW